MTSARTALAAATAALIAALALSACGDSKKGESGAKLDLTVSETGKTAKFTAPKSVKGGVQTLTLANKGKAPHSAQLVQIKGNHTPQEALKIVGSSGGAKAPDWLRAEGGLGNVAPGKTAEATLLLQPGKYLAIDTRGEGGGPAYVQFTVSGAAQGQLPSTPATVTAAETGKGGKGSKNRWRWDVKGQLKPGSSKVTFVSGGGDTTFHFLGAFRVTGNPTDSKVLNALKAEGKPPKFVDQTSFFDTAVLDGGKSQVVPLELKEPGRYVLFCAVPDRTGGKEHYLEGLVRTVTVK